MILTRRVIGAAIFLGAVLQIPPLGTLTPQGIPPSPMLAVVHLATQPPAVLQQVVIRPDKVSNLGQLIRLGETVGDEARCWLAIEHVYVVEWIGSVDIKKDAQGQEIGADVTPFPKPKAGVVEITGALAERIAAA